MFTSNQKLTTFSSIFNNHYTFFKVNVVEVAVTANYDGSEISTTQLALQKMKDTYANTAWHYTAGNGIDLHHALLHRNLGGGLATVGGICDSQVGYGITTGATGTMTSIGSMYGDIYVFLHEVG